jgi:hypothetical protein
MEIMIMNKFKYLIVALIFTSASVYAIDTVTTCQNSCVVTIVDGVVTIVDCCGGKYTPRLSNQSKVYKL